MAKSMQWAWEHPMNGYGLRKAVEQGWIKTCVASGWIDREHVESKAGLD
jgi:hypothetical protein